MELTSSCRHSALHLLDMYCNVQASGYRAGAGSYEVLLLKHLPFRSRWLEWCMPVVTPFVLEKRFSI